MTFISIGLIVIKLQFDPVRKAIRDELWRDDVWSQRRLVTTTFSLVGR